MVAKRSKSPRQLKRSKSPKRIDTSNLKQYSLTKYGYSARGKLTIRREALKKAVNKYGVHKVWNKLNLIAILNKNRSPTTSRVFNLDKNWIKRTYINV
jgi:hypothetical protein